MAPFMTDPDLAEQITIRGRLHWRWPDGMTFPVIRGGDGDPAPAPAPTPAPAPAPAPTPAPAPAGDEELGEAGKKALAAERERAKTEEKTRKAAEKERDDFKDRLEKLEAAGKSDQQKELDKVRKETDEQARKEERGKSDGRVVIAEIKAAAGARFHDPSDAVANVDLDDFKVNDEGDIDSDAIKKALDKILEDKPYLATDGKAKPTGSGDGGPRPPTKDTDVTPGRGRLQKAYENTKK